MPDSTAYRHSNGVVIHHYQGATEAVIFSHGAWADAGVITSGDGYTTVPGGTMLLFYSFDGKPSTSPTPQRLVTGNTDAVTYLDTVLTKKVQPLAISGPGSSVKNYEISYHDQTSTMLDSLNKNRSSINTWDLIVVNQHGTGKIHLSDVFAACRQHNITYTKIHYAACRVYQ